MTDIPQRDCLGCHQPLPTTANHQPIDASYPIVACACGLWYAPELIRDADPVEWQRVLDRDGYTVERDDEHTLTITRHYDKESEATA